MIASAILFGVVAPFAIGQEAVEAPLSAEFKEISSRVADNYDPQRRVFIEASMELHGEDVELAIATAPTGEFFADLKGMYLIVYDGRKGWAHAYKGNVYAEMSASEIPDSMASVARYFSGLLAYHARELSNPRRGYQLAGEEELLVGGQKRKCYVLDSPASRIWIDKVSYIIVRQMALPGQESIAFTATQFGDEVDQALFRFQIPPNAKQVSLKEVSSFISFP